jgi:hypothetical protein
MRFSADDHPVFLDNLQLSRGHWPIFVVRWFFSGLWLYLVVEEGNVNYNPPPARKYVGRGIA